MQFGAGLVLISVMLIGKLLAVLEAQNTVRIMVVALIATIVTGIAAGYNWHSGGATFAVFASGAVATMSGEWIELGHVLVVGSSAALFALLLTAVTGVLRTRSVKAVFQPLHRFIRGTVIALMSARLQTEHRNSIA